MGYIKDKQPKSKITIIIEDEDKVTTIQADEAIYPDLELVMKKRSLIGPF